MSITADMNGTHTAGDSGGAGGTPPAVDTDSGPERTPEETPGPTTGRPKWALPLGLVFYVAAFGINVTGLIPGVDISIPASAHLFAGAIGLIVLWRIAHLDKLAVICMAALLLLLTVMSVVFGYDAQDLKPLPDSAESPQLEATIAWIREEPNTDSDNDFLLRNNTHPLVTVIGESEHEAGWFRVKVPGSDEGWMFGSLLSGLEDHGYSTGETRSGTVARLVDENGDYTGDEGDTGRLVLISGSTRSGGQRLYEVILSDGTEGLVRQTDVRRF